MTFYDPVFPSGDRSGERIRFSRIALSMDLREGVATFSSDPSVVSVLPSLSL